MCNVCKTVQIAPKLKLLQTLGLLIELVSINHLRPQAPQRSCWCFAFTICLFDINGRYFALILFFSKCYFFSFLSLLFQRGAEFYWSYFDGRSWALAAFRPTVNISHGTTDPKRFSLESSLEFVSTMDMECERK